MGSGGEVGEEGGRRDKARREGKEGVKERFLRFLSLNLFSSPSSLSFLLVRIFSFSVAAEA